MASGSDAEIRERILAATGTDLGDLQIGATADQEPALAADVEILRTHPALAGKATVAGFLYDVDSGLLRELV